jgi:hypothetical protein
MASGCGQTGQIKFFLGLSCFILSSYQCDARAAASITSATSLTAEKALTAPGIWEAAMNSAWLAGRSAQIWRCIVLFYRNLSNHHFSMPHSPKGFTITLFITVANIDRSAEFYAKVFGGRILSRGDTKGASGHIQIANTWLIVNVGGGPTPDKPTVTLDVLADPNRISSFMNIRSSSRSPSPSTARFVAISAIRTVISSRSDRPPTSLKAGARFSTPP